METSVIVTTILVFGFIQNLDVYPSDDRESA